MGFFDSFYELVEAATPWSDVQAEAVSGDSGEEKTPAAKDGGEAEDSSDSTSDDDKETSGDDKEDEEEEEEEEEEIVDPREKLVEECEESKGCAPAKHHFDECVERVTGADEGKAADKKHPNEDCVEEFFHLAHCANQCAAPKLWAQLK